MRTISVTTAREQFSSVINWAEQNQADVIVQNRGKTKAIIIPVVDYELLQEARALRKKRKAIEALKKVAQEVRAANPDVTSEEADRIGRDVTRDAVESLVAKGKIAFEA